MGDVELIYTSRKFRVERVGALDRDGVTRRYDRIYHPGAAVILPFLDDGRVLLIRNYRFTLDRHLLELPAGTLDPPEAPLECARRELAEETGYTAGELKPLIAFYSTPGCCTEQMHVFTARGLVAGASALELGETIELAPMSWDEALAAVDDGRIIDAKTIVSLLYYDRVSRRMG